MDYSGVESFNAVIEKYDALGKTVTLRNVGSYSQRLFRKAKELTIIKKETIETN